MFDFASDRRDEGDQPGVNDKGLVTHDRRVKKDAFYWYKANWSDEPVTYITSRRWTRRTEADITVKVYSNAEAVALKVNGRTVGSRTSDNHVFTWQVRLSLGRNTVTAESVSGGSRHTDTVSWTLEGR
jgi:beta-galactosidase